MKNTEQILNKFGSRLVKSTKNNLKDLDKVASGALIDSVRYELNVFPNSFSLAIFMQRYWTYVDHGVQGIGGNKADGTPWKLKRVTSSKHSFKRGLENKPSRRHFDRWTVVKGLAPRTSGGQFLPRRSMTEAISHAVWRQGLETTEFFRGPFGKEFNNLPEDFAQAFGLDVDDFLKHALNII